MTEEKNLENGYAFDPSNWLSKQGVMVDTSQYDLSQKRHFKELCAIVKRELDTKVESSPANEQSEWLERQHNAIIGNLIAIQFFVNQIEQVLRDKNISSNEFPSYYSSLAEAIFHDVWGRSILQKWYSYPESEAAVITGKELWMDIDGEFVKQEEEFESVDKVKEIIRAFTMRDENAVLNAQNPELEIEHEDGSRITMIVNPRSRQNYIMFRRFTVKNFTLEKQAEFGTIEESDVELFRSLARSMTNTVFAGRVRSAKSTFMKTMIGERDSNYVIALLEKHFELALKKHFPSRLVFEIQSSEGDLEKVMPRVLRMEHDFIVIGECRSKEWEAAIQACERGERGMMTTYHLTDRHAIVNQIARHLLDEYPSRLPQLEIERVARNVDILIGLSTDRDRRKKRVMNVTEVIWDEENKKTITNDLILYDKLERKYFYSSNVSERLYTLMAEENEYEANRFIELLKERESFSPISEKRALNYV